MPGPPNVWRQWRAQRVHCTPGLGGRLCGSGDRVRLGTTKGQNGGYEEKSGNERAPYDDPPQRANAEDPCGREVSGVVSDKDGVALRLSWLWPKDADYVGRCRKPMRRWNADRAKLDNHSEWGPAMLDRHDGAVYYGRKGLSRPLPKVVADEKRYGRERCDGEGSEDERESAAACHTKMRLKIERAAFPARLTSGVSGERSESTARRG